MKKILSLLLSFAMCLFLIGCDTETLKDATYEIPSDWKKADDSTTYKSPEGGILTVTYYDLDSDIFGDEAAKELYLENLVNSGTYKDFNVSYAGGHEAFGGEITFYGGKSYLVNIQNDDEYLCFHMVGLLEDEDYGDLKDDFLSIIKSVEFN